MPSLAKLIDKALVAILGTSGLYIVGVTLKALPPKGNPAGVLAKVKALPIFAWHPLSVSLATLLLAPAGYLIIRQRKTTLPKEKKSELGYLHASVTGPALGLLGAGVYAIFKNKNINKWPHLTSVHSYLGSLALTAFIASAGVAFAHNLGYPGKIEIPKQAPEITWHSKVHRLLGASSVVTSSLAVATGVTSKWGKGSKQFGKLAYPLAALVVIPSILLAIDVTKYLPTGDNDDEKEIEAADAPSK